MDKIIFWSYLCFEFMNGMCFLLFTVLEPASEGQPCISVFSSTTKGKSYLRLKPSPRPHQAVQTNGSSTYIMYPRSLSIRKTLLFICLLPRLHSFLCDMCPLLRRQQVFQNPFTNEKRGGWCQCVPVGAEIMPFTYGCQRLVFLTLQI